MGHEAGVTWGNGAGRPGGLGGLPGRRAPYSPSVNEGKTTVRARVRLTEQRARLEKHGPGDTDRDVHRCRVAAQRIWTIGHAAQPVLGEKLRPLDEELRWLAALLTPVRDLDTLVAHLRPQVETLGADADGATLVLAALERQRSFRRNELRAAVASPRFAALLELLDGTIDSLGTPDTSFATFAERQLRKLRRTAARLDDASSDAALYVLQLRAQRARYSAELFGGAKAARYVKALTRVQELARKHEDAVAAEGWLRSLSRPKTALAVGRLIEREEFRKRAQRAALPAALATALRLGRGVF